MSRLSELTRGEIMKGLNMVIISRKRNKMQNVNALYYIAAKILKQSSVRSVGNFHNSYRDIVCAECIVKSICRGCRWEINYKTMN